MRFAFRGSMKPPWAVAKTSLVSRQLEPTANRSWSCRLRCARRMVTSGPGMGSTATDASVFTGSAAVGHLPDAVPAGPSVGPRRDRRRPREAERLTAPQSHRQRDRPKRVEPVLFGSLQEAKGLRAGKTSSLAIVGHPQLNQPRHVSTKQLLVDSILQRGPQHSQDVTDRARRQNGLTAPWIGERAAPRLIPGGIRAPGAALTFRAKVAPPCADI
jgi:hypothetical protein